MAKEQRTVTFSGTVQGVGFRFTACRCAEKYDVTGYVRNLPDGRVECLAEGPAEQIDQFISDLGRQMGGGIRDVRQQVSPYTGRYDGFTVRF